LVNWYDGCMRETVICINSLSLSEYSMMVGIVCSL
jgi:hypothetical protein